MVDNPKLSFSSQVLSNTLAVAHGFGAPFSHILLHVVAEVKNAIDAHQSAKQLYKRLIMPREFDFLWFFLG